MRPTKLGAKNHLFFGNAEADPNNALFYTLLSNCKTQGLDPETYLAEQLCGRAIRFDDWEAHFAGIDILIASTSAPHYLLSKEQIEKLMPLRADRPLFLIDIAVPRDIDPAAAEIDNVYLYDIDSLADIAQESVARRKRQMDACDRIIERHSAEFAAWVKPT